MSKRIEIIFTEDQELFRKSLINLLEEHNIDTIGEASNGKELLRLLAGGKKPDLILLDLQMPKMDGNTVLNELKKKYPSIKIVVLTSFEDGALKNDFKKKGVNAFVTKSTDFLEIVDVIKNVHQSASYNNLKSEMKTEFTKREVQIIPLVCKGKSSKQIAEALGLKLKTVESARRRLYEKTETKTLAEFVSYCVKEGLEYLGSPSVNM